MEAVSLSADIGAVLFDLDGVVTLHGEAHRGHVFWDELFAFPDPAMHLGETFEAALLEAG